MKLDRKVPALAVLGLVACQASRATAAPAEMRGAAEAFSKRLPELCATLQKRGFQPPEELGSKPKAEMRIPGLLYFCSVTRPLAGTGPGRAPEVAALLTGESDDPGAVLSANVWCAADLDPALKALSDEVELAARKLGEEAPPEVLAAIRAGRKMDAGAAPGLVYQIVPIEVDRGACGRVPPGRLGPVYEKVDVSIRPGKAPAR